MTENDGFSVVAATRMITPFSTPGSSASCWALLNRWISSRKSTVGQSVEVAAGAGLFHHLAHVAHAGGHGGQLDETATGAVRDGLGEGGLARAGGAPEDDRDRALLPRLVAGQADQRRTRGQQVALAGDLVEALRAHPHGEGVAPAAQSRLGFRHVPSVVRRTGRSAPRPRAVCSPRPRCVEFNRVNAASIGARTVNRPGAAPGGFDMVPSTKQDREARAARARVRGYQARRAVHEHQQKRRTRDNIIAAIGLTVVLVLAVGAQVFYFNGGPGTPAPSPSATPSATPTPPPRRGEHRRRPAQHPRRGPDLDRNAHPQRCRRWASSSTARPPRRRVSSTISLIQSGLLHGVPCHRLTTSGIFVLQCGDPTGTAPADRATATARSKTRRPTTSTRPARSPWPGPGDNAYSQGSQFFIVYEDSTIGADAAGGYTVLGSVTSGLDQLKKKITDAGVKDGEPVDRPVVPTKITAPQRVTQSRTTRGPCNKLVTALAPSGALTPQSAR